jgi:hypothetical protein
MLNILRGEYSSKGKAPLAPHVNGSGRLIICEGVETITPERAKRILDACKYPGQRRVNDSTVAVYAGMMRRDLWDLADPITFAELDGRFYLVNGQHRMMAIILYGEAVVFRIAVNHCKTMDEVRALYWRFDTVMRRRTNTDIVRVSDVAGKHGVSSATATAVYTAAGIITNGFVIPSSGTTKDVVKQRVVDLRINACEPFWPAAKMLEECFKVCDKDLRRPLTRATTFAVALITMMHQPEKAKAFWGGTATNDGLRRNDPRHTFVRDLLSRDNSVGKHGQAMYAAAVAWNAFYTNKNLSLIRVFDDHKLRILGTPVGSGKGG